MTRWLYGVARRCAQRFKLVIALWLIALFAVAAANHFLSPGQPELYVLKGTNSATAQTLVRQAFPGAASDANPIAIYDSSLNFRSTSGIHALDEMAASLVKLPEVAQVATPTDNPDDISDDGHTAIINVTIADQYLGKNAVAQKILDTAKQTAPASSDVAIGGIAGSQLSKPDTRTSEILGIAAALIVLTVAMRRVAGVLIPIINAVVAVGVGLSIIEIIGRVVFIPDVAPTLGIMLGLGVGIDYALFMITRHRLLLRQGFEVSDAVGRTGGTAGAGMIFAGGTLIAALCGLTLTGISFLAWLGYAAAIVVLVAVAASITLVPALLAVSKQRILPKNSAAIDRNDDQLDTTAWGRLATRVTSRPWRYAIVSTLILLVMAFPMTKMSLGVSDTGNLPTTTTARQAYDILSRGFGPGSTAPLAVVSQLYSPAQAPGESDNDSAATTDPSSASTASSSKTASQAVDPRTQDPRLVSLRQDIEHTPGVISTGTPVVSTDGGVAIIQVTTSFAASDPQNEVVVETLRTKTIPPATQNNGMAAYVGGVTAARADLYTQIIERTPWFIAGVVLLSFLLLMVAYRSLLIPFKAAMMNLLSISAAYGVVTMIFDWGWGAQLIGLPGPVPIDAYVPMMMFAVLFGLSMDYEVFLLTAFREHWERTGDMHTAIRRGLADTGQLVTAAALIMIAVFASFIFSDFAEVKLFGVGLATAVAVDATIVRCLLVPAIMILAAKGTWWLPGWLDRLIPQLHIEGDPAQLNNIQNQQPKPEAKPVGASRPIAVIGIGIGVALAWLLVSRLPELPASAMPAIALSAVLAGVTLLLPPWLGGGNTSRISRTGAYIVGVLLGISITTLVTAITPPGIAATGLSAAWAIIVLSLLIVLVIRRSIVLSVVLGALTTAICFSLMVPPDRDITTILIVSLLPLVIVGITYFIVTSIAGSFGYDEATNRSQTDLRLDPSDGSSSTVTTETVDSTGVALVASSPEHQGGDRP